MIVAASARSRFPLALGLAAGLLCGCERAPDVERPKPGLVAGTIALSGFGGAPDKGAASEATRHTLLLIPGPHYAGMHDNDIRGFPNGRWVHGWNQEGQRHIRLGRGPSTARFGEMEIVRALQRWDDLPLPAEAVVTQASLELVVEAGIDDPVDVMLYEAHRDWNPGSGGSLRDNTSPPEKGEVWWPEAARGEVAWGLPGASFASDDPEKGDVAPSALATARYAPGASELVFSSNALAAYVQRRVASSKPLLFVLKLSDADEDVVRDHMVIFSAEEGDRYCFERRPKLRVEWHVPSETVAWEKDVLLENGRVLTLPKLETNGATRWAVSFQAAPNRESPALEVRGGRGGTSSAWRTATVPLEADWEWIQARLLAAKNPVALGARFESELADTWVPDAEPDDRSVVWHFTDALGREIELSGAYQGQYRWRVELQPKVLGRWSYYVDHDLNWPIYRSETVVFDVIADDVTVVLDHLEELAERIDASNLTTPRARFENFGDEFLRLERAGIQLLTPEDFRSERGAQFSARVDEIRGKLGEPLPDQPTSYDRKIRRSLKRDFARMLYEAFGVRLDD